MNSREEFPNSDDAYQAGWVDGFAHGQFAITRAAWVIALCLIGQLVIEIFRFLLVL